MIGTSVMKELKDFKYERKYGARNFYTLEIKKQIE